MEEEYSRRIGPMDNFKPPITEISIPIKRTLRVGIPKSRISRKVFCSKKKAMNTAFHSITSGILLLDNTFEMARFHDIFGRVLRAYP
jgi:hypothetical protein